LIETTLDALSVRYVTIFAFHGDQFESDRSGIFLLSQHLKLLLAEFASKLIGESRNYFVKRSTISAGFVMPPLLHVAGVTTTRVACVPRI
jgi:hypothetical protein